MDSPDSSAWRNLFQTPPSLLRRQRGRCHSSCRASAMRRRSSRIARRLTAIGMHRPIRPSSRAISSESGTSTVSVLAHYEQVLEDYAKRAMQAPPIRLPVASRESIREARSDCHLRSATRPVRSCRDGTLSGAPCRPTSRRPSGYDLVRPPRADFSSAPFAAPVEVATPGADSGSRRAPQGRIRGTPPARGRVRSGGTGPCAPEPRSKGGRDHRV